MSKVRGKVVGLLGLLLFLMAFAAGPATAKDYVFSTYGTFSKIDLDETGDLGDFDADASRVGLGADLIYLKYFESNDYRLGFFFNPSVEFCFSSSLESKDQNGNYDIKDGAYDGYQLGARIGVGYMDETRAHIPFMGVKYVKNNVSPYWTGTWWLWEAGLWNRVIINGDFTFEGTVSYAKGSGERETTWIDMAYVPHTESYNHDIDALYNVDVQGIYKGRFLAGFNYKYIKYDEASFGGYTFEDKEKIYTFRFGVRF